MLDAMAYNSFVYYKIRNPEEFIKDSKRKRCGSLINMAHSLIKPCIDIRFKMFQDTNFAYVHQTLINSFKLINVLSSSKYLRYIRSI